MEIEIPKGYKVLTEEEWEEFVPNLFVEHGKWETAGVLTPKS